MSTPVKDALSWRSRKSAVLRGSYHLYQGFGGFVGNIVMGLVFGRVWQRTDAQVLVDESPQAYKDIDQVMRDQADLVEVVHELRAVATYKGTS